MVWATLLSAISYCRFYARRLSRRLLLPEPAPPGYCLSLEIFSGLNDFIAYHGQIKAGGADPPPKTWIWLQKLKELYVGASRLMQDRCNFWVKMSQAGQTSITAWETTARTAAGRCLFGTNAEEFMRDKFLFGLNEFFTRFREHIFYRDGQRKPDDPPSTLAFVVSQTLLFETAQQTNKLLATSAFEEQFHYTASALANKGLPQPLKDLETDPVFSGIANNNTFVTCAQRPEKSAATATKPAISHTFVSRPSEPSDPPVTPPKTQIDRDLAGRHSVWELLYPLRKTTS